MYHFEGRASMPGATGALVVKRGHAGLRSKIRAARPESPIKACKPRAHRPGTRSSEAVYPTFMSQHVQICLNQSVPLSPASRAARSCLRRLTRPRGNGPALALAAQGLHTLLPSKAPCAPPDSGDHHEERVARDCGVWGTLD